jgi:GNAT superfamily N-acetyltransferase
MSTTGVSIRQAAADDAGALWTLLERAMAADEYFSCAAEDSREAALSEWLNPATEAYVALEGDTTDGRLAGAFYLRPNYRGRGKHVASAAFAVATADYWRGLGRAMFQYSLEPARHRGYRAMLLNYVPSTNREALKHWRDCGFAVAATIPGAIRHQTHGPIDAYILHRFL